MAPAGYPPGPVRLYGHYRVSVHTTVRPEARSDRVPGAMYGRTVSTREIRHTLMVSEAGERPYDRTTTLRDPATPGLALYGHCTVTPQSAYTNKMAGSPPEGICPMIYLAYTLNDRVVDGYMAL